jgi:hypothetical protein
LRKPKAPKSKPDEKIWVANEPMELDIADDVSTAESDTPKLVTKSDKVFQKKRANAVKKQIWDEIDFAKQLHSKQKTPLFIDPYAKFPLSKMWVDFKEPATPHQTLAYHLVFNDGANGKNVWKFDMDKITDEQVQSLLDRARVRGHILTQMPKDAKLADNPEVVLDIFRDAQKDADWLLGTEALVIDRPKFKKDLLGDPQSFTFEVHCWKLCLGYFIGESDEDFPRFVPTTLNFRRMVQKVEEGLLKWDREPHPQVGAKLADEIGAKGHLEETLKHGLAGTCSQLEVKATQRVWHTQHDIETAAMIHDLHQRSIVDKVPFEFAQICNGMFSKPKEGRLARPLLDPKSLNECCVFTETNITSIYAAILAGWNFGCIVDYKDAYFSAPIAKEIKPYLCF